MKSELDQKEILITGGTGSLGKTLVKLLIKDKHDVRGIRVFSRDEAKHWQMKKEIQNFQKEQNNSIPISYIIGDVRNYDSLYRAFENVDIVIHTAALKQVPACEDNPLEAVMTNVTGTENVIKAALARNVKKIMYISTDKAVLPVNLYGATKSVAEKLIIHANTYSGRKGIDFSCCRYGNVLASRGSVVHTFKECASQDIPMPVTHSEMTRFWISLPRVGRFLLQRLQEMKGGEIFIPKMDMLRLKTMSMYIWKKAYENAESYMPILSSKVSQIKIIGVRQGEKLHECLIAHVERPIKVIEKVDEYENIDYHYVLYPLKKQEPTADVTIQDGGLYSNSPENHVLGMEEFFNLLEEEV